LAEGDEVVTAGQQRAQKDGTAVKVVELGKPSGKPPISASAPASAPAPAALAPAALAPAVSPQSSMPAMPGKPQAPLKAAQKPLQGPNPCMEIAGPTDAKSIDAKSAGNMRGKS
jgi:membrane fusion protein, multidrug efflux system